MLHPLDSRAVSVILVVTCPNLTTLQVFLEVMNSVLMTGEIPGLFAKDEMMAMTADLRNAFLKVRSSTPVRVLRLVFS